MSSIILKCFWEDVQVILALLNSYGHCVKVSKYRVFSGPGKAPYLDTFHAVGGSTFFFNLRLKMTSWACLIVSGLKFIFHWVAQLLILSKSLSRLFAKLECHVYREQRVNLQKALH